MRPFAISGSNVTIDGIAFEGLARCIEVRAPGAVIRHSSFSQFAKARYGYAIHVLDEGMNPTNVTVIESNTFDEWGGAPHSAAVILGTQQGAPYVYDSIAGHALNNRFTRGPTAKQAASAGNSAIQAFEPFLARGNYIHTVTGPAIQNKTKNSVITCNTIIECRGGWGALYNRALGNNKWTNNVVMDSETGFDHFAGDNNVFSGNVFYNMAYMGRIKNFQSGSHNLVIENNTFCLSSGWTGFVWDPNSGGTFSDIVWRNNIFYSIKGRVISWRGDYDASIWDEHSNVFWQSTRPSQPTTGSTGSSVEADPQFDKIPTSFVVGNPALKGKGAAWPCPCADTASPR